MSIIHTLFWIGFGTSIILNIVTIGSIICVANDREDIPEKIAEFLHGIFCFVRNKLRVCFYKVYSIYCRLRWLPGVSETPVWVGKEKEYLKRYAHD